MNSRNIPIYSAGPGFLNSGAEADHIINLAKESFGSSTFATTNLAHMFRGGKHTPGF